MKSRYMGNVNAMSTSIIWTMNVVCCLLLVWVLVALVLAATERRIEVPWAADLQADSLPVNGGSSNGSSCAAATRAAAGGWRYRTTPALRSRAPLLWISSQEGMLSHYYQVEKLWRIVVLQHGRPLLAAPFSSYRHYKDIPLVRLCDYFLLPPDVLCVAPPQRLRQLGLPQLAQDSSGCRCKIVVSAGFAAKPQYAPFASAEYFNLTSPAGHHVATADFASDACLAGFVDNHNGFPEPPPFLITNPNPYLNKPPRSMQLSVDGRPVKAWKINMTRFEDGSVVREQNVPIFPVTAMSKRYMSLVPVLRAALGVWGVGVTLPDVPKLRHFKSSTADPASILTVVHWRRGDYLSGANSRCSRGLDVSVNCNSTIEFITEVKRLCSYFRYDRGGRRKNIVYVATNEDDEASLAKLRRHGFKVKADLLEGLERIVREANAERGGTKAKAKAKTPVTMRDIFPLPLPLNSADDFAIDMALVCTADEMLHFGYSNYNKFVLRCRPSRSKS